MLNFKSTIYTDPQTTAQIPADHDALLRYVIEQHPNLGVCTICIKPFGPQTDNNKTHIVLARTTDKRVLTVGLIDAPIIGVVQYRRHDAYGWLELEEKKPVTIPATFEALIQQLQTENPTIQADSVIVGRDLECRDTCTVLLKQDDRVMVLGFLDWTIPCPNSVGIVTYYPFRGLLDAVRPDFIKMPARLDSLTKAITKQVGINDRVKSIAVHKQIMTDHLLVEAVLQSGRIEKCGMISDRVYNIRTEKETVYGISHLTFSSIGSHVYSKPIPISHSFSVNEEGYGYSLTTVTTPVFEYRDVQLKVEVEIIVETINNEVSVIARPLKVTVLQLGEPTTISPEFDLTCVGYQLLLSMTAGEATD